MKMNMLKTRIQVGRPTLQEKSTYTEKPAASTSEEAILAKPSSRKPLNHKVPTAKNRVTAADALTQKMILSIENGTAPWIKPWDAPLMRPMNGQTGKHYRGANVINLMSSDYQDPRWCTYNQAKKAGWQVRKGEKSEKIFYYGVRDIEVEDPLTGELECKKAPYFTSASVFNFSQIDGVPELSLPSNIDESGNVSDEIRQAFNTIVENSGVEIKTGYRIAAYSHTEERIYMPDRERFESETHYMSTVLHELCHWTANEKRLNRDLGTNEKGSPEYAIEELKAEMASVFIASKLGVPYQLDNHSNYIASYLKTLNDDPKMIWKASKEAELISEYVLGLHPDYALEIEAERSAVIADAISAGTPPETFDMGDLDFSAEEFAPTLTP